MQKRTLELESEDKQIGALDPESIGMIPKLFYILSLLGEQR